MNINLAILHGIDNKFKLIERTISICHKYFDNIFLFNSGGDYTYSSIKHLQDNKTSIYNINNLWGDTSSPRRYAAKLCNENDWIFWLDSDECPSQLLLDNLENIINYSEKNNSYNIKFGSSSHLYDINGNNIGTNNPCIKGNRSFPYSPDISIEQSTFHMNRLLKVTNYNKIEVKCLLGGHSIYRHVSGPTYRNFLINHYKSLRTAYKSATLHTWSSPITNISNYKGRKEYFNSKEYAVHSDFIKRHKVYTSTDLVYKLNEDSSFLEEIRSTYYIDLFKNSKYAHNHIYKFLEEPHNFNLEDDVHNYKCDYDCCKYKNYQF